MNDSFIDCIQYVVITYGGYIDYNNGGKSKYDVPHNVYFILLSLHIITCEVCNGGCGKITFQRVEGLGCVAVAGHKLYNAKQISNAEVALGPCCQSPFALVHHRRAQATYA